jgi:ribonuclease-3
MTELERTIGYTFTRPELLREALTHRSYAAEQTVSSPDNQRLEFLGDAVIQIVITERIYSQHPEVQEGHMTKMRAVLTRQPALARLARHIQLGNHLLLGNGERRSDGARRPSNLCDVFEALIGAVFIDCGHRFPPPARIVNRLVAEVFPNPFAELMLENPKGTLQEWSQKTLGQKPTYETVEITGPDHEREFTIDVVIAGENLGRGVAGKRQAAEQEAARTAVVALAEAGRLVLGENLPELPGECE